MRRLTLALAFSIIPAIGLAAQQTQTPAPAVAQQGQQGQGRQGQGQQGQQTQQGQGQQGQQTPRPSPASQTRNIAEVAGLTQPGTGQNVQLVIKITDSFTTEVQTTKMVGMLVADTQSGQIRSSEGAVLINIDARPVIQRDGRIRLQLTVEYRPDLTAEQMEQLAKSTKTGGTRITMLTESLTLMVADGRATVVSQSSDPRSDRKVSLEVTATIVK